MPRVLFSASWVLLFLFRSLPAFAQQPDSTTDLQAREAAALAMNIADVNPDEAQATTERRPDLENVLQNFDSKAPGGISFYDERPASAVLGTHPARLVAVNRSTHEVYRLNGFDTSQPASESLPAESVNEFNRMTSVLQLSVAQERAITLAALFLDATDPAGRGEIALDEDAVWFRLVVQDHFLSAYGDVWRALRAYADWWEQFRAAAPEISPLVTVEPNGRYLLILKRLVRSRDKQPEVQNWELEVARNGEIRVLSKQLIFPLHSDSLFYDFR